MAAIPAFPIGPSSGQELSQAVEEGPQKYAANQAAVESSKAQTSQAQLSEQTNNKQVLQGIVAPALSNPELAKSPQWQKLVQEKTKGLGIAPPTGGDGSFDPKTLMGMLTSAPLPTIDAAGAYKLAEIPAGPARDAMAKALYNPASLSAELLNAPMIPSQATIESAQKSFNASTIAVSEGKMTPAAYLAGINKDMLPYFGQSWENVNRNPQALAGLTSQMQANIQKAQAAGVMDRAKAQEALSGVGKNNAISEMDRQHGKLFGAMPAILNQREQISYDRMQQNGQKTQAYVQDVNSRIDIAHNGSFVQAQTLRQKDMGQLLQMKKDADVDVRQAYAMINTAKTNGNDYTAPLAEGRPSLLDSLTNAQASAKAVDTAIAAIKSPSLAADAARGQLNAIGGAGVTNNPQGASNKPTVVNTGADASGKMWNKMSDGTVVPAQ